MCYDGYLINTNSNLPVCWKVYINLLIDLRDSAKQALLFPLLLHFHEVLFWNKHAFTKSFKDSTKRSHVFFTKFSFQVCILHNYSRTSNRIFILVCDGVCIALCHLVTSVDLCYYRYYPDVDVPYVRFQQTSLMLRLGITPVPSQHHSDNMFSIPIILSFWKY